MKIYNYRKFINEGRSTPISSDNYLDSIMKYASWYEENNYIKLYRSINSKEDILIIDPSKHNRKPLGNTDSYDIPLYYNNIMNESKYWTEFTNIKRSKSIFTTNNIKNAKWFMKLGEYEGDVYRVIPFDYNSNFVVCSNSDTFDSFSFIKKIFNENIINFSERFSSKFNLKYNYNKLEDLKKDFHEINPKNIEFDIITQHIKAHINYYINRVGKFDFDVDSIKNGDDLFELFMYISNPIDNGFKLTKFKDIKDTDKTIEYYTDCKCLLIKESLFK